jgi:hypothetical protein
MQKISPITRIFLRENSNYIALTNYFYQINILMSIYSKHLQQLADGLLNTGTLLATITLT